MPLEPSWYPFCSGAFILAKTGLADGRSVATHQICQEALGGAVSKNRRRY